jgi:hypothetical protein
LLGYDMANTRCRYESYETVCNHHVIAATVTHAIVGELLVAVFSVGSALKLCTVNRVGALRSWEETELSSWVGCETVATQQGREPGS